MTELAIILIALLNIVLILGADNGSYIQTRITRGSFALSMPVGILSILALVVIGGPLVLSLVAALAATLNLLHFVLIISDGAGGG